MRARGLELEQKGQMVGGGGRKGELKKGTLKDCKNTDILNKLLLRVHCTASSMEPTGNELILHFWGFLVS